MSDLIDDWCTVTATNHRLNVGLDTGKCLLRTFDCVLGDQGLLGRCAQRPFVRTSYQTHLQQDFPSRAGVKGRV